jgi:peroxiredoxin
LQRWEAFKPEFESLGVRMVAFSPDTVHAAAGMKRRLGVTMTVLADESLAVTDLYNLRHAKALAGDPKRKFVRPLAIPTTILVDGEGIVRWIDQAEDYRVRSDADRVLAAVRAALDSPS